MTEENIIEAKSSTPSCDGGGGPLGHPLVYLKILPSGENRGEIVCPYCSRHYVLSASPAP